MRALHTAATGMAAQQLRIDNIAHNLANVNTTGFKKASADFEDLYYQKVRTGGGQTAAGTRRNDSVEIGHGTRTAALRRDFAQGGVVETGRSTDVAIRGDGFFMVRNAEGEALYTRSGNFTIDADGNLVTIAGMRLEGDLQVPQGASVEVASDGVVTAQVPGEDATQIGQIQLARFANAPGLEAMGSGLYRETEASGTPTLGNPGEQGMGDLLSRALETSNVDVAEELIAMIMAQRSYELTSKVISTADQMLQFTNQLK
jgi:flagellar basal-body rod protein FlgG